VYIRNSCKNVYCYSHLFKAILLYIVLGNHIYDYVTLYHLVQYNPRIPKNEFAVFVFVNVFVCIDATDM